MERRMAILIWLLVLGIFGVWLGERYWMQREDKANREAFDPILDELVENTRKSRNLMDEAKRGKPFAEILPRLRELQDQREKILQKLYELGHSSKKFPERHWDITAEARKAAGYESEYLRNNVPVQDAGGRPVFAPDS